MHNLATERRNVLEGVVNKHVYTYVQHHPRTSAAGRRPQTDRTSPIDPMKMTRSKMTRSTIARLRRVRPSNPASTSSRRRPLAPAASGVVTAGVGGVGGGGAILQAVVDERRSITTCAIAQPQHQRNRRPARRVHNAQRSVVPAGGADLRQSPLSWGTRLFSSGVSLPPMMKPLQMKQGSVTRCLAIRKL